VVALEEVPALYGCVGRGGAGGDPDANSQQQSQRGRASDEDEGLDTLMRHGTSAATRFSQTAHLRWARTFTRPS